VAVAATTRTDALYSLSNFGATSVHWPRRATRFFQPRPNRMTPTRRRRHLDGRGFVTGSLALLRPDFPSELHAQLIHRLLEAADPVPNLAGLCATGSRLDLRRALGIPLSPPVLQAFSVRRGEAPQLRIQGEPGRTYVIEACSDFLSWTAISTNISDLNGTFIFKENMPPNPAARFYRARLAN